MCNFCLLSLYLSVAFISFKGSYKCKFLIFLFLQLILCTEVIFQCLLSPPGGIVITRVCLFLCSFVRYAGCDFLESTRPISVNLEQMFSI